MSSAYRVRKTNSLAAILAWQSMRDAYEWIPQSLRVTNFAQLLEVSAPTSRGELMWFARAGILQGLSPAFVSYRTQMQEWVLHPHLTYGQVMEYVDKGYYTHIIVNGFQHKIDGYLADLCFTYKPQGFECP